MIKSPMFSAAAETTTPPQTSSPAAPRPSPPGPTSPASLWLHNHAYHRHRSAHRALRQSADAKLTVPSSSISSNAPYSRSAYRMARWRASPPLKIAISHDSPSSSSFSTRQSPVCSRSRNTLARKSPGVGPLLKSHLLFADSRSLVNALIYRSCRSQRDPRQDLAGTRARAIAAAEALRAAASDDGQKAPLGALTLKSEPGPPMTLGSAAATRVRQIVRSEACRHQVATDPPNKRSQQYAPWFAFGASCFFEEHGLPPRLASGACKGQRTSAAGLYAMNERRPDCDGGLIPP